MRPRECYHIDFFTLETGQTVKVQFKTREVLEHGPYLNNPSDCWHEWRIVGHALISVSARLSHEEQVMLDEHLVEAVENIQKEYSVE